MVNNKGHNILVTNIQRFSLHDGPGIRTTVFLKGCSLCCPWCSNPENISANIQAYIKDGIKGKYGAYYNVEQLYSEVIKDKIFYTKVRGDVNIYKAEQIEDLPGGVTFSGGECLLQIRNIFPLIKKLREEEIHTAVETSLFVPETELIEAIKGIDFFYVDIKILDEYKCKKVLSGNLKCFLSNVEILMKSRKPVVFRIPVISEFTDDDVNRRRICDLINKYASNNEANLLKVELIKEHKLGLSKYQSLIQCNEGYTIPNYKGVSDELMEHYKTEIVKQIDGIIPVEICKI